MRIKIKNARITNIKALWTAKPVDGVTDSKPRYGCSLILPRDHPQIGEIKAAQLTVAKERWEGKAEKILKAISGDNNKIALRDGDMKSESPGFEGNYYLSANAKANQRPKIRAANGRDDVREEDGIIYPGCYVIGYVDIFAVDTGGAKICVGLGAIQFQGHGEPLGGAVPVSDDEFEILDEEDEFDDIP